MTNFRYDSEREFYVANLLLKLLTLQWKSNFPKFKIQGFSHFGQK